MSSRRSSGVIGTQDGVDAVGNALQQLAQALAYLKDVVRLQNQEAERRMQEALRLQEERLREMDRQLQEKDDVIRGLQQRLQVTQARAAPTPFGAGHPGAGADEEVGARRRVELRVREVELRWKRARTSPSPLGELLCEAACEGRLNDVRRLIDSGADVNYTNQYDTTPLLRAVFNANADVVSLLLQRGADVNAVNSNGSAACHWAAMLDHSGRCVEVLVRAGADVNARNIDGETPLHRAACNDNVEAVRALLAAGARRDLKPWGGYKKGRTPFETTTSPYIQDLLRL